jgi:hypothetical protein
MVDDFRGQRWTAWFLWKKKGITLSDIHHSLSAICGEKSCPCSSIVLAGYKFSTEAMKLNRWLSVKWYYNIPEELFCEAIQKLPMRWQ